MVGVWTPLPARSARCHLRRRSSFSALVSASALRLRAFAHCPQLSQLLPFVLLNLSLDLVRLSLQLVAECLQFIGALTLSFCALALRFCEAENTLCLSHEVLDVFFGEHSVPYLSTSGGERAVRRLWTKPWSVMFLKCVCCALI